MKALQKLRRMMPRFALCVIAFSGKLRSQLCRRLQSWLHNYTFDLDSKAKSALADKCGLSARSKTCCGYTLLLQNVHWRRVPEGFTHYFRSHYNFITFICIFSRVFQQKEDIYIFKWVSTILLSLVFFHAHFRSILNRLRGDFSGVCFSAEQRRSFRSCFQRLRAKRRRK